MAAQWSVEDIETLKVKVHEGLSLSELSQHFNRTETGIYHKMKKEGLKLIRLETRHYKEGAGKTWTSEEIDILKDKIMSGETVANIAKLLNRNIGSVYGKIAKLKLKIIKDENKSYNLGKGNSWTLKELEILKQYAKYPCDIDKLCELLGRAKSGIYGKMQRLGLSIQDPNSTIENICDRIIDALYNKTKSTACHIEGITVDKFDRCVKRIPRLQEKYNTYINWKKDHFICYICSKVYNISEINIIENINEHYQHKICKYCEPTKDLNTKHFKHIYTLKGRLNRLVVRSRKFDKDCDYDTEYLKSLYNSQEGKCYYSGFKMKYKNVNKMDFYLISIDQKEPGQGYTKDNIVLCCWGLNRMKNQLNPDEFVNLCQTVVDYNAYKKLNSPTIT